MIRRLPLSAQSVRVSQAQTVGARERLTRGQANVNEQLVNLLRASQVSPPCLQRIAARTGSRTVLVFNRPPDWGLVALGGGIITVLLVGSAILFKTLDRYFADVI